MSEPDWPSPLPDYLTYEPKVTLVWFPDLDNHTGKGKVIPSWDTLIPANVQNGVDNECFYIKNVILKSNLNNFFYVINVFMLEEYFIISIHIINNIRSIHYRCIYSSVISVHIATHMYVHT